MLTACLLIGFDALAVVALAAAVVIAITGGGRVEVPGLEIRAHSTGSLLLFLIVVLGPLVSQIPMAALVAVMIMVSISTFSWKVPFLIFSCASLTGPFSPLASL